MTAIRNQAVPDTSRHTPMFRIFTVRTDNTVQVSTYQVGVLDPLARHAYRFTLPAQ